MLLSTKSNVDFAMQMSKGSTEHSAKVYREILPQLDKSYTIERVSLNELPLRAASFVVEHFVLEITDSTKERHTRAPVGGYCEGDIHASFRRRWHMSITSLIRISLLVCVALFPGFSFAQDVKVPQFANFPAKQTYSGNPAPVILRTSEERMFRTRLKDAAKEPPNFAGDYVLTAWGCGTTCLAGAVVSLRTGRVIFLPGSICCWDGEGDRLLFRENSRLLIMAGIVNQEGEHGAHFYEFTGNGFQHLKTIPVANRHQVNSSTPKVSEISPTEHEKVGTTARVDSQILEITTLANRVKTLAYQCRQGRERNKITEAFTRSVLEPTVVGDSLRESLAASGLLEKALKGPEPDPNECILMSKEAAQLQASNAKFRDLLLTQDSYNASKYILVRDAVTEALVEVAQANVARHSR